MNIQEAVIIFDALSQETRLKAFRMLVKAGSKGLSAGYISGELGIAHNSLSFHLNHLCKSGVVFSKKEGRFMIYKADFDVITRLIAFIVTDCCRSDFANIYDDKEKECAIIKLSNLYVREKEV